MVTPLSIEFTGLQIANPIYTVAVSLSLTAIFFVILTNQVGLYLWRKSIHSRDPLWIRGMVVFIWMMQALEFALSCHMTAMAHSDDSPLSMVLIKECLQEWTVYVATCVATEGLVHAYFISRIYILETNHSHVISIMLCTTLILEGVFGLVSMLSFVLSDSQETKYIVLFWPIPVWLGFSILVDILIAGSICYILKKDSPFLSMKLNLWIKRFTRFCIQTGLITGLVTGITVGLWTVAQLDPTHLLMGFPIGGIYATCFMANLIARESYFCFTQADDDNKCFEIASSEGIVFATPSDAEKSGVSSEVN